MPKQEAAEAETGLEGTQQRAPAAAHWAPKLEVAQGIVAELEVVAGLEVSLG